MDIAPFISKPAAWMKSGDEDGIAVSSRIRLARNLSGRCFPTRADARELHDVWEQMRPLLKGVKLLQPAVVLDMGELGALDRQLLFERHLISHEHLHRGAGSGVVMKKDQSMVVMVNEEDHLRFQGFSPGMNLRKIWRSIDKLDSALQQKTSYAFSPKLGYLTACPTNVGTGLRASVMLHLPGLFLTREIAQVLKGVNTIGLTVRGLWGEGSEAGGHLFQISNQATLGKKEVEIVNRLEHIVNELAEHERNARGRLVESRRDILMDQIGRARGIIENAWIISSREALDLLSMLRLAIVLGLEKKWRLEDVNELLVLTRPAHLQVLTGKSLDAAARDRERAVLVRERLNSKRREEDNGRDE